MAHPKKTDKCIPGVKCIVESCEYNNTNNECLASSIEVEYKGADATTSKQTDCATFIPKLS